MAWDRSGFGKPSYLEPAITAHANNDRLLDELLDPLVQRLHSVGDTITKKDARRLAFRNFSKYQLNLEDGRCRRISRLVVRKTRASIGGHADQPRGTSATTARNC